MAEPSLLWPSSTKGNKFPYLLQLSGVFLICIQKHPLGFRKCPQNVALSCPELRKPPWPSLSCHISVISHPLSCSTVGRPLWCSLTTGVSENEVAMESPWPGRINHWKEPENKLNLQSRRILTQTIVFLLHSVLKKTKSLTIPIQLQYSCLLCCNFSIPLRWAFSTQLLQVRIS